MALGFAAVGGAAAFALAGVLGFATLVAGLATALALACVLALTGVLAGAVIGEGAGLGQLGAEGAVGGGVETGRGAGHESGDCGAGEECFVIQCFHYGVLFWLLWFGICPRRNDPAGVEHSPERPDGGQKL